MKLRIDDIGSILDNCIRKASSGKSRSISDIEDDIRKTLTHNPFVPDEVSSLEGSPHYTPYLVAEESGFYPHPPEYWVEQGKDPLTYREVHKFYEDAGIKQNNFESLQNLYSQAGKFSFLKNSLSFDLMKYDKELVIDMEECDTKEYIMKSCIIDINTPPLFNAKDFKFDIIKGHFISEGLVYLCVSEQ